MNALIVCALLSIPLLAEGPEQSIRKVLDDQVTAWNRGDVRSFMDGYEDSAGTTFVGTEITRGHAAVLERYVKRYPTKANMGILRFSDIEIRMLGSGYASVLGRFHLERGKEAGGEAAGIFTLLVRQTQKGWKVIQDHTS